MEDLNQFTPNYFKPIITILSFLLGLNAVAAEMEWKIFVYLTSEVWFIILKLLLESLAFIYKKPKTNQSIEL